MIANLPRLIKKLAGSVLLSFFMVLPIMQPALGDDMVTSPARTLRVALYPYVPDLQAFKTALQEQWKQENPNVAIQFVDWDCYVDAPRTDIDVFVFDATYFPTYWKDKVLYPLGKTLPDQNQYPSWLLTPAKSGDSYFGIAQKVCVVTLVYR